MARLAPPLALLLALSAVLLTCPSRSSADCLQFGPIPLPNVVWGLKDSVSACPGGDTLVFAGGSIHPARLRIGVHYEDALCNVRAGVPPESIWVTYTTASGNLAVNDAGVKVFADDSTDAGGNARITIPSFSGAGRLQVRLYVSGVSQGTNLASVRTTDTDADGRTSAADLTGLADLNYDGVVDAVDQAAVSAHDQHWHRNALHGTLVKRTSLAGSSESLGSGRIFWSPSGRYLSFSLHPPGPCSVFIAASDPGDGGNALRQVTFPPAGEPDYDPSWSPLGDLLIYGRQDNTIFAHRLVGFGGDGSTYVVTTHNDGSVPPQGDIVGTVYPDGQWVAFCRRDNTQGPIHINVIPISGGEGNIRKLTNASSGDWYPTWSPDGQWITFQRETPSDPYYRLLRVRFDGDSTQAPEEVFTNNQGKGPQEDSTTPDVSPDGLLLVAGIGPRALDAVHTGTLDLSLATKPAIANYSAPEFAAKGDPSFPILSPILSPDGTRLALAADEVWSARRNMNLPPVFTSTFGTYNGTRTIADTAVVVDYVFGLAEPNIITVQASDPEDDALTYHAAFLQTWMSWDPGNRELSGTPPPGTATDTYYVKFWVTTESGGTDSFIARIAVHVRQPEGPAANRRLTGGATNGEGPNPTRTTFAMLSPFVPGQVAEMTIFDITGRRLATVRAPSGERLIWDGMTSDGVRAATGVYLWRMAVGERRQEGKFVVVR